MAFLVGGRDTVNRYRTSFSMIPRNYWLTGGARHGADELDGVDQAVLVSVQELEQSR